jgi:hypothetical protein
MEKRHEKKMQVEDFVLDIPKFTKRGSLKFRVGF